MAPRGEGAGEGETADDAAFEKVGREEMHEQRKIFEDLVFTRTKRTLREYGIPR